MEFFSEAGMQLIQNSFVPKAILIGTLCALSSLISGCGAAGQQVATTNVISSTAPGATSTPTSAPSTSATAPAPPAAPAAPSPSPAPPAPTPDAPTPTASRIPHSSHVVLVIEENKMFTEVYPNGMPWLVAQGNKYGYASNYHADVPGSMMDYLWLSSGSGEEPFGCVGDGCRQPITSDNIFRELGRASLTWKVYAQSLPSAGYMGPSTGAYAAHHNPAKWYSDVIDNSSLQQNIVPLTQLALDLAANQLPNYSIIIPDGDNDGWDGSMASADNFLAANIAPLLSAPYFQAGGDAVMFITFDECDEAVGTCPGNEQVYTAVIGPKVKPGTVSSTPYKHENTLRTILDALGVTVDPGASSSVADMKDFF